MTDDVIVEPSWLTAYKKLEAAHGNYTISDDESVQGTSTGKVHITRSMLRHFNDLSRTPLSSQPSPAPNPEFTPR